MSSDQLPAPLLLGFILGPMMEEFLRRALLLSKGDASVFFTRAEDIDQEALRRWLQRSREVQWDYKNLVKRKGRLERLK